MISVIQELKRASKYTSEKKVPISEADLHKLQTSSLFPVDTLFRTVLFDIMTNF